MKKLIALLLLLISAQAADSEGKDITTTQAWIFGMITAVGLCGLGLLSGTFILAVQQCISVKAFKSLINILYALGCGAMIGDVMVHTLPQAFKHPDVKYQIAALLFIIAIVIFILIERLFMECGVNKSNWQIHKDFMQKKQGFNQGVNEQNPDEDQEKTRQQEQEEKMTLNDHFQSFNISYKNMRQMLKKRKNASEAIPRKKQLLKEVHMKRQEKAEPPVRHNGSQEVNQIKFLTNDSLARPMEELNDGHCGNIILEKEEDPKLEDQKEKGCIQRLKGKGTAGYLNIITSFIHNIFDGFAIGAGFGARVSTQYLPVLIAVYAHEVPREMGDVGIMMKNRFTGWQTVFFNSFTNITAVIGCGVALGLGEIGDAPRYYVLCFAAGNFMYIAADIWRHLFKNKNFWGNVFQFLSFCLGVGIEYLLILTESHD